MLLNLGSTSSSQQKEVGVASRKFVDILTDEDMSYRMIAYKKCDTPIYLCFSRVISLAIDISDVV